jgi:hypothetical protein
LFFLIRKAIKLGIVLLILIALVVGADIGSRIFTQDQMASAVQRSSGAGSVSVSISSFPFLYHLVAQGEADQITIRARNVPVGPLTLSEVDLTADNVVIDRNQLLRGHERLDSVGAVTATVVYQLTPAEAALASAAGITATPGSAGVIDFEAHGQSVFSIDLAAKSFIPACRFAGQQSGTTYTFTCSVSPVPQAVLNSLSR